MSSIRTFVSLFVLLGLAGWAKAEVYYPAATMPMVPPGIVSGVAPVAWNQPQVPQPVPLQQDTAEQLASAEQPECEAPSCCRPFQMFGEALYLRPRNQEVSFAVPANGAVPANPTPVQIGDVGVADFDYEPGFRVGGSIPFGQCSRLRSVGTWYEADTTAYINTLPPLEIAPMITHPSVDLSDRQFLEARARYLLDFELIDVDWVRVLTAGPSHEIDLVLGARYASMTQELRSYFIANDFDTVISDIAFEGGGARIGLESEWYSADRCWLVYAKGAASFVAGDFRTWYAQDNNLGQRLVDLRWRAGRVVSMLDLELGAGWSSANGACRVTAGYLFSGWFNCVNTAQFIDAVQTNEFADLSDAMSFDGLVGRIEFRF